MVNNHTVLQKGRSPYCENILWDGKQISLVNTNEHYGNIFPRLCTTAQGVYSILLDEVVLVVRILVVGRYWWWYWASW